MSNDPSLPPDQSETVEAEKIGDVVVLRVSWPMHIPNEKARVDGAIAFPQRMLFRVIAAIHGAAGEVRGP